MAIPIPDRFGRSTVSLPRGMYPKPLRAACGPAGYLECLRSSTIGAQDGPHVVMTTAVMIKRACGTRGEPDTAQSPSTSRCHNTATGWCVQHLETIRQAFHESSNEADTEWPSPLLRERRIFLGDHGGGSHVLRVRMGRGGYPTSVVERAGMVLGSPLVVDAGQEDALIPGVHPQFRSRPKQLAKFGSNAWATV